MSDLQIVCGLFDQAIKFQRSRNYIGWNSYDISFIQKDIAAKQVLKILQGDSVIGIFSVCFNDELIWRELENNDAIYLHRIISNHAFAGSKVFEKVLNWAIQFAKEHCFRNIRMDTWADNFKIINYYKSYGFRFVRNHKTGDTNDLPTQHRNLDLALLQYSLD